MFMEVCSILLFVEDDKLLQLRKLFEGLRGLLSYSVMIPSNWLTND